MGGKYRNKKREEALFRILKLILVALLSYVAIMAILMGGNTLFKDKVISQVDTQTFKDTLNSSFPLIDTVYNSGNDSISLSGEIKGLIKQIFTFDLNDPLSILNAQSSMLYSYYNKGYQDFLARMEKNSNDDYKISYSKGFGDEKIQYDEIASSISIGEEEKKAPPENTHNNIVSSGKIVVQNETKYKFNIDELMEEPLKFKFNKKGPKVLIYHTHTTESYIKTLSELNKSGVSSRTQDPKYSVVRVGEELAQNLRKKFGIEVIHNGTVHDYPDYNSSYGKSLNTVNKILKSYPSIRVVIDLHRDGLGEDQKLRAVTKINKKNAAQVMFVVGTNENGLEHPQWRENLKFALKLQEKLNEISPGLAKPIYLSHNRYNQHVQNGALIIEVGGDGNTIAESMESTKYLAKAIYEVTK